jgi:glycosyltransferase involved in cell wall biosynthesis
MVPPMGLWKLSKARGCRVVRHDYNRDYGSALKTGIRLSRYPLIASIDADGAYPSDVLQQLVASMDQYDMVVGSRPASMSPFRSFAGRPSGFLKSWQIT